MRETQETQAERWQGNRRHDGLRVSTGLDGWIILPREALAVDRCPCCGRIFDEALHARFAADFLYTNGVA